jgi:hypothetical protein
LGNLIFLVGAIGLSVVGSLLLWYRQHRPSSHLDSVAEFQREMSALGSERPPVMRAETATAPSVRAVQGSTVHVRPIGSSADTHDPSATSGSHPGSNPGPNPGSNPGAVAGGPSGGGAHDAVWPDGGGLTGGRR